MECERITRSGRIFSDWHHEKCGVDDCEKAYCRKHRRLYWICQDFSFERNVNYFGGDGECIVCAAQYGAQKAQQQWVFHQQHGL